jgi:general stress protein YciG
MGKFKRGNPETVEAARQGGVAAHATGMAHEFTPEEAREAGRKGGIEAHRRARERKAAIERGETAANASTVKRGE